MSTHVGPHAPDTFVLHPDGAGGGDVAQHSRLAEVLVYVSRLGSNVGDLLRLGDPTGLATTGSQRLEATYTWNPAREATVWGNITLRVPREAHQLTVVGGADLQAALSHCVARAQQVPGVRWAGVVTADMRVVAVHVSPRGAGTYEEMAVLPSVGARALAMWQALPSQYRTDSVVVRYGRASVVVTGLGRHVLVAFADDDVDEDGWAEATDEVRAVLATQPVAQAPGIRLTADLSGPATSSGQAGAPSAPARRPAPPVGARYRAGGRRGR